MQQSLGRGTSPYPSAPKMSILNMIKHALFFVAIANFIPSASLPCFLALINYILLMKVTDMQLIIFDNTFYTFQKQGVSNYLMLNFDVKSEY